MFPKMVRTDSQLSHQEKNIQQTSQQCLKWTRTMHSGLARQGDQAHSPTWTSAHVHCASSRRVHVRAGLPVLMMCTNTTSLTPEFLEIPQLD